MHRLAPESIARFTADVERLISTAHVRLGLAVSGGPDSLALLLLAHAAFPGKIAAATVDHGLRSEAADEASFVASVCAERGIQHRILTPATPITGSTQMAARTARYTLLEDWATATGCDWVATAHHVDDQVETLLMRLNRGAGVGGLAGVRRMNGRIIRPLLGWRRAELAGVVAQAGIMPVDDPSNHDPHYDRVRMRQALQQADWLDAERIAASAHLLAEANTALDWMTDQLARERLKCGIDSAKLDISLLPRELRRRLTLRALQHIDPKIAPRGQALIALIEALGAGETRTLGAVLAKGGALWRFTRARPRGEI